MGKFVKMIKSLPPEMRMMLMMVGLGSPVGAIYFLRRFFPHTPMWQIILCVGLAIAGIALLAFVISKIFGRGAKKRSKKMANDLASESTSGPSKVDASAAIKANNEKFFKAVRDMRKEARISVYDLPWYVVIGDSGCGKTFLVNNGGLTFSLGKPEGYQLGTLNYNWWFTEDAVFIDMAGRLCNPQDDGDRREWEAFLTTVAKGRRGFPINGTILCISMEHLLEDPPEKHESDAVIALERLRDLQSKLGVTFATYVVITKSDRLVGFLQYFDRPDKGAIKNQMFGWSRPGEFSDLHDPEQFQGVFDSIYARLHELRLRRLNDDADEIDLGLAYAFPEEFRRLYQPLQTYVRILFPYLKKTHAVKNLLFRGLYFTSATQDDMIPPGTVERYGPEGADQLAKLQALFPKTAYFIKDVMFRKIFPENGLVFRNEQEVVRNRKLANLLKYGTIGLAVILATAFGLSFHKFGQLVLDPREHASEVADNFANLTPDEKLVDAERISGEIATLNNNIGYARILSINIGPREPVKHLKTIRAQLIESTIVAALGEIEQALRSGDASAVGAGTAADNYLSAVKEYIAWFGCAERDRATHLKVDSFKAMWSIVSDSTAIANQERFLRQVEWYFEAIGSDSHLGRNPANLLKRVPVDHAQTILTALDHVYAHFHRYYASLDAANHADPVMREWVRIRNACVQAEESYGVMMDMARAADTIETQGDLQSFAGEFVAKYRGFDEALEGTQWGYNAVGGAPTFQTMAAAILAQYNKWHTFQDELRAILEDTACAVSDQRIIRAIETLTADETSIPRRGLDCVFWENLRDAKIARNLQCSENIFQRFGEGNIDDLVQDVFDVYGAIIMLVPGRDEFDKDQLVLTSAATNVRGRLRDVADGLDLDFSIPEDLSRESAAVWAEDLKTHLMALDKREPPQEASLAELPEFWRKEDLGLLYGEYRRLVRYGQGTTLLTKIRDRLRQLQDEGLGFAAMIPQDDRLGMTQSPYTINVGRAERSGRSRREDPEAESRDRSGRERSGVSKWAERGRRRSRGESGDRAKSSSRPTRRKTNRSVTGRVPAYATHEFLNDRAEEMASLLVFLRGMGGGRTYLALQDENERLHTQCLYELESAGRAYMLAFVRDWNDAYGDKTLDKLDALTKRVRSWNDLVAQLGSQNRRGTLSPDEVVAEFDAAMATILQVGPFASYSSRLDEYWDGDADYPEWVDLANWMYDAQETAWNSARLGGTDLRRHADERAGSKLPWDAIAGKLSDSWRRLCEGIKDNAKLPKTFERPNAWSSTSIPWGEIEQLRDRYRFGEDEKLTGALLEFERKVQELLSVEVTRILADIQERYLGNSPPDGGWPFMPGEKYTATGLNAVDFVKFKKFLVEVRRAEKAFEQVEKKLVESAPGRRERLRFFERCAEWNEFLDLKDKLNTGERALGVVVRSGVGTEDANSELFGKRLDDTAQHAAKMVVVDLGLKILSSEEGEGDGALRIRTETQYKKRPRDARWEWKGTEGKELLIRLDQVLPGVQLPDGTQKKMGMSSPLAICTYLYRYGDTNDSGKTWYVLHGFRRGKSGAGGGPAGNAFEHVGERLIYTLDRRMPDPIPQISRPST